MTDLTDKLADVIGKNVSQSPRGIAHAIIAALPSAIIRIATERDELLNQNDSLKHSIDVLERRLAAALGKEGE